MLNQQTWLRVAWILSCFLVGVDGHESKLTDWVKRANVTELACEGQKIVLSCDEQDGIKVKSAFWGRNDPNICKSIDPKKTNNICKPMDPKYPLKKVSDICDASIRCEVEASEAYFEVPLCPRVSKYFKVVYDCRAMSGLGSK
jgi:hypothetical protein